MKKLDVQYGTPKMPEDVKEEFFWYCDDGETVNGEWVRYEVGQSLETGMYLKENVLDEWLINNCNLKEGQEIELKHWW